MDQHVDSKDVDIFILSGFFSQNDAEVRMLESSSGWPTLEWIERAVINQNERLRSEQSAVGSQAMLAGRGNGHNSKPSAPSCPLCSRTGHTTKGCREYIVTEREHKRANNRTAVATTVDATSKRHGEKGRSQINDGSKIIYTRCYFSEGPHKSEDCDHRLESIATPAENQPKNGEFIGGVRRNLSSGIIASAGTGSVLTANVTIQRQDGF